MTPDQRRLDRRTLLGMAVLAVGGAACATRSADDTTTVPTAPVNPSPPATATPTLPSPSSSTTAVPTEVYPLTGLPISDPTSAARPALVVKIDNNAKARPQTGLGVADIVFEEIVEAQTRFAAVFHSRGSDPVGPIRSGRTQDIDLLGSFDRPLFMWSGGNDAVTAAIESSDLRSLSALDSDAAEAAGFFREADREKPHNLYATCSGAWSAAPPDAGAPPAQFVYRAPGVAPVGASASMCSGEMDGLEVMWRHDAGSGSYLRWTAGKEHRDMITGQIAAENVVVLYVEYRASAADARSPEADTIGSGDALVCTAGVVVEGTWRRDDRRSPVQLTAADGTPIALTPGRTWVELARANTFSVVA